MYPARDTKLNREVALKVLPDLFADDPGETAAPPQLVVVQNWFEELKRLVPSAWSSLKS